MQEIFDAVPMTEFEKKVLELRSLGKDEEAEMLAYLIAVVTMRSRP